jgi:hypothetical protein
MYLSNKLKQQHRAPKYFSVAKIHTLSTYYSPNEKKCLLLLSVLLSLFSISQNWKPLFNGKDFTGWRQLNDKAKYTIEKDEIVGTTVFGEANSFLVTEKDYGDFVLEFQYKMDRTL